MTSVHMFPCSFPYILVITMFESHLVSKFFIVLKGFEPYWEYNTHIPIQILQNYEYLSFILFFIIFNI